MLGLVGSLANSKNPYGYLCFLFLATELNDVAGFVFGKTFGRHLIAPRISPRKTWEGSLGALVLSLFLPWLLHFSFPFFGRWQNILTGLVIGLGGQLGDFTFSGLKRRVGIKDWGDAIPGHGGVLDRMDSLVFTAPLFSLLVRYYYPDS
jgi:phosphatidate cytidylyltransferase